MKLNIVSGRDMCKILEKIEFKKIHQVGSHVRYIQMVVKQLFQCIAMKC